MIRTNSIVFKFSLQLTVIVAILFSVLVLSNIYSLAVVRNNSIASSNNTLAIYEANIHNYFNNFERDLTEVFENNIDLTIDFGKLNESSRYFKSMQLRNALAAKMTRNDSSDGMFIVIPEGDVLLGQFSNRIFLKDKLLLSDFLRIQAFTPEPSEEAAEWAAFGIQGSSYLFKSITFSGISFVTFVKADTLLSLVNRGGGDMNRYVLSDRNGHVLSSNNIVLDANASTMDDLKAQYKRQFMMLSKPILEIGQITNLVEKPGLFSGLKLIQWLIVSLAAISLIVVPLVLKILARDILKPVLELVKAAKDIEKGQLEFPQPSDRYSMEFTKLFHSFQSMVREITELKIHSYEEQIERSRMELKYLQMQIRPHFFLNAISTITSLTYSNKNEEIRRLISHLSEHLRYMFTGALVEVPIEVEIKHTENYILMQEIRYPDQIFYMTEIDDQVGKERIPQFMIQTFVENTFKHALVYGEMLSIFIRAGKETREGTTFVKIVIEDNGGGFSSEWLQEEADFAPSRNHPGQVGIANIRKTLQLLYKRDDLLKLSNAEAAGARVELWIPMLQGDEREEREGRYALFAD
ncbi:sensor histidine kinase [Paenibacillus sp. YIM B09110]|uniref:sensor histidine kinase n=1 Tax=Paenibacillus sp. YIM B09110 TaxID=3126102 RepID=UPI00301BDAF0